MYKVKDKFELRKIIENKKIPLDTLDISAITDMSYLFQYTEKINGSISNWDTSNVTNMAYMFKKAQINPDISRWNISSVNNILGMFFLSNFNQDISSWDISNLEDMRGMFQDSNFNQNLGSWDLKDKDISIMFQGAPYTIENYNKDREKYLLEIKTEKTNNQSKILKIQEKELNESLNYDIILTTIEMEF